MVERVEAVTSKGSVVDLFGVDLDDGLALGYHAPERLRRGATLTVAGVKYRLVRGLRAGLRVVGGPTGLALDAPVEMEEA